LVVPKDLQSRDIWIFDNQETIPLDFDVMVREDDNGDNEIMMMRGTEIKAGDKIQSTCVYDSTSRDEPTKFYLSTYDEMCFNHVRITFDTPASLLSLNNGTNNDANMAAAAAPAHVVDLFTELELMKFSCADDTAEADVYSGILTADEDGRNIWKDHPIEDAEGCTFVTNDFLNGALTEETRNCDNDNGEDEDGEGVPISVTLEGTPEDDGSGFVSSSSGDGLRRIFGAPIALSAVAVSVSFVLAIML